MNHERTKILTHITATNAKDWLNEYAVIDASTELRMSYSNSHGFMQITDLRNALLTGEVVTTIRIESRSTTGGKVAYCFGNLILQTLTLRNLYRLILALPWETDGTESGRTYWKAQDVKFDGHRFRVHRSEKKAIRVFSPLHIGRVKPLKKAPKKWTVNLAVRAILNGQFSSLKCNGRYTDDYAYDAAVNFGQGTIGNHVAFGSDILESPSGWRVYEDHRKPGRIHINCHSFDTNEFRFQLMPAGALETA